MILMIDNYDSFTYNLVQYFGELGADVMVYRNDKITIADIEKLKPKQLVISPGPCTPNEAGISMDAIKHFAGQLPILGVCLGLQCMTQILGGRVVHGKQVMQGKMGSIHHDNQGIFTDCAQGFQATRYHSLVAEQKSLPKEFTISAWTQEKDDQIEEIMGLRHNTYPMEGVQFHPESIKTEHGKEMLANFLNRY